jgi:hypothetical protein
MSIVDFLKQPWPWWVAGPLIGLMVPVLLLFDNKQFGISSTLRDFCAYALPKSKGGYFNYDLREHTWRNVFVLGILFGGLITVLFLNNNKPVEISSLTVASLQSIGLTDLTGLAPAAIFGADRIFTINGLIFLVIGGFAVGFGTRYADGCTSGHAITGLSLLSIGSLVAVLGFFTGGLISTHLIFPLIF